MIKHIIEFILALSLSILPLGATETPAPAEAAVIETEVHSHQSEGAMLARMENMLNKNYCFGEDFESAEAMILSAEIALKNQIDDGFISENAVNDFVFNMYGVDVAGTTLSFGECENGCYPVPARGYDEYRHTVTDYEYNGDGTITVETDVVINQCGESETAKCVSVFFADGTSIFGYNLISSTLY